MLKERKALRRIHIPKVVIPENLVFSELALRRGRGGRLEGDHSVLQQIAARNGLQLEQLAENGAFTQLVTLWYKTHCDGGGEKDAVMEAYLAGSSLPRATEPASPAGKYRTATILGLLLIFLVGFSPVAHFGSRWQSQRFPIPNVTVHLDSGPITGAHWVGFDGQHYLRTGGLDVEFDPDRVVISGPPLPERSAEHQTWRHWRSYLPVVLWSGFFVVGIVMLWLRRVER